MAEQDERHATERQNSENKPERLAVGSESDSSGAESNTDASTDPAQSETEITLKDESVPENTEDSSGMTEDSAAGDNSSHNMNTENDVKEG